MKVVKKTIESAKDFFDYHIKRDTNWKCADGIVVRVSQMEDRHLENCLALIYRRTGFRENCKKILEREAKKRGMSLDSIRALANIRKDREIEELKFFEMLRYAPDDFIPWEEDESFSLPDSSKIGVSNW